MLHPSADQLQHFSYHSHAAAAAAILMLLHTCYGLLGLCHHAVGLCHDAVDLCHHAVGLGLLCGHNFCAAAFLRHPVLL